MPIEWLPPGQVADTAPPYLRKYRRDEPRESWSDAQLQEQRLALARLRLDWELLKFAIRGQKAGFDPAQPRDDHGKWTDAGLSGFRIVAAGMPRIPQQRPPNSPDRTATAKLLANI